MSEEKKALPKDVLKEIEESEHPESGHDVAEMAKSLEGKIPTEKKEEE